MAPFISQGQEGDERVDSLQAVLDQNPPDSTRSLTLTELSRALMKKDREKAIEKGKEAMEVAERIDLTKGKAAASYQLAYLYFASGLYKEALPYAEKAVENKRKLPSKKKLTSALNLLGILYKNTGQIEKAQKTYSEALKVARELEDKRNMSVLNLNLGNLSSKQGKFEESNEYYRRAIQYADEIGYTRAKSGAQMGIGVNHKDQGNYPKALDSYFKVLKIHKADSNRSGIALAYNNIGNIYNQKGNHEKALEYYRKALKLDRELDQKDYISRDLNNIGIIHKKHGDFEKALKKYWESANMAQQTGDPTGVGQAIFNISKVYLKVYEEADTIDHLRSKGNSIAGEDLLDSALALQKQTLKINKENNDLHGKAYTHGGLGKSYLLKGALKKAEHHFRRSYSYADSIGALREKLESGRALGEILPRMGRYKEAVEFLKEVPDLKDTLLGKEKLKAIQRKETQFEYEKKMLAQKKEFEKKQALAKEKARRQRILLWSGAGGLVIVLGFLFLLFNRYRLIQRQKKTIEETNQQLNQRNQEVNEQRDILDAQKGELQERNKEITDSINYAQRIQSAIFQNERKSGSSDLSYFILLKPKDIVSGDFYWVRQEGDLFYIAAADCTGHGVPGAFMSMLGISFLNEILTNKNDPGPAEILDDLRDKIIKELGQTGKEGETRDGMDISLACFDTRNSILKWAGANNPLYRVTTDENEDKELTEFKADKQPIGYTHQPTPFQEKEIQYGEKEMFYLFTDGFSDQFGGKSGKKFKYRPFKELLKELSSDPPADQRSELDRRFEEWRAGFEQVDDVCIIGIRPAKG